MCGSVTVHHSGHHVCRSRHRSCATVVTLPCNSSSTSHLSCGHTTLWRCASLHSPDTAVHATYFRHAGSHFLHCFHLRHPRFLPVQSDAKQCLLRLSIQQLCQYVCSSDNCKVSFQSFIFKYGMQRG